MGIEDGLREIAKEIKNLDDDLKRLIDELQDHHITLDIKDIRVPPDDTKVGGTD